MGSPSIQFFEMLKFSMFEICEEVASLDGLSLIKLKIIKSPI
jgi:hypothetical protein